jgi:hypothetical protein
LAALGNKNTQFEDIGVHQWIHAGLYLDAVLTLGWVSEIMLLSLMLTMHIF